MAEMLPILVPVDERGSDLRALRVACAVGDATGRPIRLLSVVGRAEQLGDTRDALHAAAQMWTTPYIDVVVFVDDDVESAVSSAANSASLVCMTTAATVLPHEGHFGSIAESVVRSIARPVVLVGPKAVPDQVIKRVVVPLDGSAASEAILADATELARSMSAQLWVVTVVEGQDLRKARQVAGSDIGALESGYIRRVANEIRRESGLDAQFEVLHGPAPAAAILDFAHPDAMVAMSTHGRSGLERLVAGSVATDVIAKASNPVLVLRPPQRVLTA